MPDLPLWICGNGPEEAALRRQARDLGNVHFMGHLPPQALAARIRSSRVVAVPSRWYENFPYAVLEGQVAGRAVVASQIGGIPEQIDHGKDGLLVPPGKPVALAQAVGGLLCDGDRAVALGKAGRARVEKTLDPQVHVKKLLGVYDRLATVEAAP